MVTGTFVDPLGAAGAEAVQVVALEHDVGATVPPKLASTWPSELTRFTPVMVTLWPAGPDVGLSDVMCGPGPEGAVVVVAGPPLDELLELLVDRRPDDDEPPTLTAMVTAASTTTTAARADRPTTQRCWRRRAARTRSSVAPGSGGSTLRD
jgi:hypothetical protein